MNVKKVLLLSGGTLAIIAVVVVVVVLGRDEAQQQYDAMAVRMEDHCNRHTNGSKCEAYAACYREGIEAAWPPEALVEHMRANDSSRKAPDDIEHAVMELERNCGAKVGLQIAG